MSKRASEPDNTAPPAEAAASEYLTTREVAGLLRIKERKVYDLAAAGDVPVSRATGKLLFPRKAIEDWVRQRISGAEPPTLPALPNVLLGSHDPLLEWALRQSRCGLATFLDGSLDGIARFKERQGLATGLHLYDASTQSWNVPAVSSQFATDPVVLVEWAQRRRGLIIGEKRASKVRVLGDLSGLRLAMRQRESGAQLLLEDLLATEGIGRDDLGPSIEVRSETEAATSVLEGKVDAAFGLDALARQFRLGFVPVITERFDLLVDRRAWFEPAMQALLGFCASDAFRERAGELAGYDVSALGKVHFNGA